MLPQIACMHAAIHHAPPSIPTATVVAVLVAERHAAVEATAATPPDANTAAYAFST
jgi:hypothetical protein